MLWTPSRWEEAHPQCKTKDLSVKIEITKKWFFNLNAVSAVFLESS